MLLLRFTVMTEEKIQAFDYKLIRDDFHRLLVATGNRLEREWPDRYWDAKDGQMILLQFVRHWTGSDGTEDQADTASRKRHPR
jgi:hypothetical protein